MAKVANPDPNLRFTYKVTHTYCVQSTGPILGEQLVEEFAEEDFENILQVRFAELTHCGIHVCLAYIHGEETENTDWSLF